MSRYIVLEVPDNFDFRKKFSSEDIAFCGDEECGYYTLVRPTLKLLVNHIFYDPRHKGLPRRQGEE